MSEHRWLLYALLSALAAALVAVFSRAGVKAIDPNVATLLRSVVMTLSLLAFVTATGGWRAGPRLPALVSRPALLVLLAGLAGAASWLFYFNALRLADVSRVAPVDKLSTAFAVLLAVAFLGERPTGPNWLGVALMLAGAYLAAHRPAP